MDYGKEKKGSINYFNQIFMNIDIKNKLPIEAFVHPVR